MAKIVSRGDPIEPVYLNNLGVAAHGWGIISGLAVSQRGAGANMSVDVAAGEAWIDGTKVTKGSITNVVITAAHASYVRYDLIVINSSGAISVIDGTAGATSYANDYDLETNNAILLAEVEVPAADNAIETAQITDKRISSFIKDNNIADSIVRLDTNGQISDDYLDGLGYYYLISDDLLHDHATAAAVDDAAYSKKKTITINTLYPTPTTLRICFTLGGYDPATVAYGKIYKNGVAYGTERINNGYGPNIYTEDLSFAQGDKIEVWCKYTTHIGYVRDLRVKGTNTKVSLQKAITDGNVGIATGSTYSNSTP